MIELDKIYNEDCLQGMKQIFRANDVAIIPNVRDYIKIGDDNHRVVERTFEYFPDTKKAEICECTITVEKLGIEVNL